MTVQGWNYRDHISEERRARLSSAGSFAALVEFVIGDATNIALRVEPGRAAGLSDCLQPLFTLDLPTTGDAFFSGPFGYRAQYWLGPGNGLAANVAILNALSIKLLAAVAACNDERVARIDVGAAIRAVSAKIWIRESSALLNPTADLAVERWAVAAQNGIELAKLGLMGPEATKFEIKGALLDPHGHEVIPASKIARHWQIHHYGYS
jgi:hypothetical protein